MDVTGRVFVVTNKADGIDPAGHILDLCDRGAHTNCVDLGRGQLDLFRIALGFVALIDRHQIHAHRRFTRPILSEVRIHRSDPVENLGSTVFVVFRIFCPLTLQPDTAGAANRQRDDR